VDFLTKLYSGNYKKLLAIPLLILIITGGLAFVFPTVPRGIDLSGGTLMLIRSDKDLDAKRTEELLSENFELTDLSVVSTSSPLGGNGLTIRFAQNKLISSAEAEVSLATAALKNSPDQAMVHANNIVQILAPFAQVPILSTEPGLAVQQAKEMLVDAKEGFSNRVQELISQEFGLEKGMAFQKKEVSPTLGSAFYGTALNVGFFAILFVTIVIFLFFRKIVPSAAVIASAFLDVIGALGLMALFNIPLTLSSIPALLMLIGYSVDTDVMLTTKLLKRTEQTIGNRIQDALKTGLTMNITTIAALTAMLILSYFTQMLIIFEISAVLLFGLIVDLSSTWFMNAPVLLWYMERERAKK